VESENGWIFMKKFGFLWLNSVVEGLESVEEEEKYDFWSFQRVLEVSEVQGKFWQSNGVNFLCKN
jgi:hypothetical protein